MGGCHCSRDSTHITANKTKQSQKNQFVLKIHIPNSQKIKLICHYSQNDNETFTTLLNQMLFSSKTDEDFDVNFISVYNSETDSFEYYIQRLAGYEMENEETPTKGKLWNFYLNQEKMNYSFLCNNNRIISVNDEMALIYEKESINHSTHCYTNNQSVKG